MNVIHASPARPFVIEPATADDARSIAELHRIAADGVADYIWSTMVEDGEELLDVGERRYGRTGVKASFENCLVIRDVDGSLAANILAYPMTVSPEGEADPDPILRPFDELEEDQSLYINSLCVAEKHRGQGMAKALLRHIEDVARERGLTKTSLICFEQNREAMSLYRRRGYVETNRVKLVPHPLIRATGDATLMVNYLDAASNGVTPMTKTDAWGAPVSTTDQTAIDGLNRAHGLFQGYFNDPVAVIDQTLETSPDFSMGHLFKAGLYALSTEKAAFDELPAMLETLGKLEGNMNDRERGHLAALRAWRNGDLLGAVELWGDVVAACPRDAIALQFAHQGDFLFGQTRMLRDRIDWVLPYWTENDPGYGFLHGMRSFGLEETGDYGEAESAARYALSLNKHDTWATHGLAHVFEMQGRTDLGIEFMESTADDWSIDNGFSYHNWWHLALYYLERDDPGSALRLFDDMIHPAKTDIAMELLDGAALLWRLFVLGHDTGSRWHDIADVYEGWVEDGYYVFNDMHAMMSFVATGRHAAADGLMATLDQRQNDDDINGLNVRQIGLPVCRAFMAFGQGRYDDAVRLLRPVRVIANRFGGSHAQRDVLDITMLESAIRAGDIPRAAAFSAERLARKPESPLARQFAARIGNRP
ncbi:MAG: GNAT family N-acetyltransferase [Rhodospirillales bacterium]